MVVSVSVGMGNQYLVCFLSIFLQGFGIIFFQWIGVKTDGQNHLKQFECMLGKVRTSPTKMAGNMVCLHMDHLED